MRVGVPRSLSFFYLWPLYETFLNEIGVTPVESPKTGVRDLSCLSLCPTDEPCVSVKVAFCHAKRLLDAGVDVLFVPTVVSLSDRGYCCPKMMGLPAMLRAGLDLSCSQVASPVIDMKDDPGGWPESWVYAAWSMGAKDTRRATGALEKGLEAWQAAERAAVWSAPLPHVSPGGDPVGDRGRDPGRVPDRDPGRRTGSAGGVTAVMGHAYVLQDIFASKVVDVARSYGEVFLAEMVEAQEARAELRTVFDGEKMWSIEGHILGAALSLIRRRRVDRLVFVSAFSCGPASIIEGYIMQGAEDHNVPFLSLCVDEHSGEAGLITRLEAFMDSTARPRRLVSPPYVAEGGATKDESARRSSTVENRAKPNRPGREVVGLVSMGNLGVPVAALLKEMGADVAPAPELSQRIVDLGKEIAPEFICYPMVTLIGQMRTHAEQGVRRMLMVQGKGRCRLGWYAQVMEGILKRNGYDVRVIAVDSPLPLRTQGRIVAGSIVDLVGQFEPFRIAKGLVLASAKMAALDRGAETLREVRAFEAARGSGDKRYCDLVLEVDAAATLSKIALAHRRYVRDMRDIPEVECEPLKIALVGEIYVVNEPFVNKDVEKVMGSMERRVRVHRKLDVSGWVSYHLLRSPRAVREYREVTGFAAPYLPVTVGGHGQESVGETVLAKRNGYDGVLHLFPFTCMPEIIAQNVLVRVSRDLDIPVLSLMLSEQTGLAGLYTRLEAFCDLLDGRRKRENARGQRT